MSSDKTAENRLEKLGLSPKMKKMMLDRFSDEISSAETISIKTDFYVQKDDGTLSQVTESDYTVAVKEQKQKISENEKKIKENIEKFKKTGASILWIWSGGIISFRQQEIRKR